MAAQPPCAACRHRLAHRPGQTAPVRHYSSCLKVKGGDVALHGEPISELRSVTCRMGSHSVTCHLTQVNAPHLNPSQTCRYLIYLPWRDGRLSWTWCWLYTQMVYLSTDSSHPSIIVSPTSWHYVTKPLYSPS